MNRFVRRVLVPLTALVAGLLPGVIVVQQAEAITKMTHSQAAAIFSAAGITWSSTGNCSDWNVPTCTSFTNMNDTTVYGARTFKQASGCAMRVTGGTEVGHASGTYSHRNGYKIDWALSTCIQNYINANFTRISNRPGDNAPRWQSGAGNIYARESNHWDVLYYNCGGC
ncbi:hypothetical protein [Kribbella deserti]|uniref:Uncharacterized protein n=1 Tax=Kribbella deserti TaxID=1926257 RepID=A0ABV6QDA4_9ACTN